MVLDYEYTVTTNNVAYRYNKYSNKLSKIEANISILKLLYLQISLITLTYFIAT